MEIKFTKDQLLCMFTEVFEFYVKDGIVKSMKNLDFDNMKNYGEAERALLEMAEADVIECLNDVEIDLNELGQEAISSLERESEALRNEDMAGIRRVSLFEYKEIMKNKLRISDFLEKVKEKKEGE